MTITNLYLIRHGEGAYQVARIIPGRRGDAGLSPLGREQAARLRDRLTGTGEIRADVLIASSLPRAHETARIIQPALGLEIQLDDEVQELRNGDQADGLGFDEAQARFGPFPDFRQEPFKIFVPGAENWPQFMLRATSALERISREHAGKNIVVVCHGGIIDASMTYFFGLSALSLPRVGLDTHNTSLTHWQKDTANRNPEIWQLKSYNDTMHLRGIETGRQANWADLAGPPVVGQDETASPLPTENE